MRMPVSTQTKHENPARNAPRLYSEHGAGLQGLLKKMIEDTPKGVNEVGDKWEEGDGLGLRNEEEDDEVRIVGEDTF